MEHSVHVAVFSGNFILSVEDKSFEGMSNEEATKFIVNEIRNKSNVTFVLNIAMNNESFQRLMK